MAQAATNEIAPVAVIIPCYNYGHFVGETIESVLNQTLQPAEVIVVDDGSTDDTREVCERYDEVRYIWQENGGVSTARNRGIQESTADYLMFPDSDDLLVASGIETLWRAMQQGAPEVKAVFGWAEVFGGVADGDREENNDRLPPPEEILAYVDQKLTPDVWILSDRILERLIKSNVVAQCSAIIERSVYDQIGLWDRCFRYHQDRDIWLRIAAKFPICFVNKPVSRVRRHDENITHNKNWIRNHSEILDLLNAAAGATWAPPTLRRLAKARYASGAYLLGQRLAESGDLPGARHLMRAALERKPFWPKPALRWMQYSVKGVLSPSASRDG